MIIKFQKFQGAGNDFIIIDNRNQVYEFTREIVEYFCDRKFGIGADGLMLLETCLPALLQYPTVYIISRISILHPVDQGLVVHLSSQTITEIHV